MKEFYFKMKKEDFQALVSGGIIKIKFNESGVQFNLCLADIGFDVMDKCITNVESGDTRPYTGIERRFDE